MSMEKVIEVIKKYDRFLITSHIDPEGDSIGSQLAMSALLKGLKKKFIIINQDSIPRRYSFLPHSRTITTDLRTITTDLRTITTDLRAKFSFQVALVLDCSKLDRTGRVCGLVKKAKRIVNIDHHINNETFGHINWVDSNISSTGEMVYLLFRRLGIPVKSDAALFLYVAILTDTGSFRYANTTAQTHRIVAHLLESGIKPKQISGRIYETNTFAGTKLLGLCLRTLKRSDGGKIAWMKITPQMLRRTKARMEDADDFINFARFIEGVEVAALFSPGRKQNAVKVSFRSNEDVDTNAIAVGFGGGGHKTASGCTLKGSMVQVERKVLAQVRKAIRLRVKKEVPSKGPYRQNSYIRGLLL